MNQHIIADTVGTYRVALGPDEFTAERVSHWLVSPAIEARPLLAGSPPRWADEGLCEFLSDLAELRPCLCNLAERTLRDRIWDLEGAGYLDANEKPVRHLDRVLELRRSGVGSWATFNGAGARRVVEIESLLALLYDLEAGRPVSVAGLADDGSGPEAVRRAAV